DKTNRRHRNPEPPKSHGNKNHEHMWTHTRTRNENQARPLHPNARERYGGPPDTRNPKKYFPVYFPMSCTMTRGERHLIHHLFLLLLVSFNAPQIGCAPLLECTHRQVSSVPPPPSLRMPCPNPRCSSCHQRHAGLRRHVL
ncbi:unnamed protein product, partial [Ectocarpus sp. 6 AP-2014]